MCVEGLQSVLWWLRETEDVATIKLGSVRALGEGSWHWKMMVAASFSTLGLFGLLRVDDHCSPGPLHE